MNDTEKVKLMLHSIVFQTLMHPVTSCYELWRKPFSEPEIDRVLVCSCMLSSIGFDAKRCALQVEFSNGCLYRIDGVPAKTFDALMQANNFDQHFRESILNRFELTKIGTVMPMGF